MVSINFSLLQQQRKRRRTLACERLLKHGVLCSERSFHCLDLRGLALDCLIHCGHGGQRSDTMHIDLIGTCKPTQPSLPHLLWPLLLQLC